MEETASQPAEYNEKERRNFFCSKIQGFNLDGKFVALGCGSWDCESCRSYLAYKAKERIKAGLRDAANWHFWTFTMPNSIRGYPMSSDYAYSLLPHQWDRLRNAIRYRVDTWEYFAVIEGQPKRDLMPHFHVISSIKMPTKFPWKKGKRGKEIYANIHDVAHHCGFGYQAKQQKIDSDNPDKIVWYATKMGRYLLKDAPGFEPPKGFRRIRTSQKWPKLPEAEKSAILIRQDYEYLETYIHRVAVVVNIPDKLVWERYRVGMARIVGVL